MSPRAPGPALDASARRRLLRRRALAAVGLFGAGVVAAIALAGCGGGGGDLAAGISTVLTDRTVTRPAETVTETQPGRTIIETRPAETVIRTETAPAPAVVTSESTSSSETPWWVWALVGIGVAGLVALVVWLIRRRHGSEIGADERQQRLFTAVSSRTSQGWTLESESTGSAVLSRGGERVLVAVDAQGRLTSTALGEPGVAPAPPSTNP